MPEEEPEQEPKGFFVGIDYWVNGAKLTFDYKMPKKKDLTKEQWRIAYWKLRNQYRKGQLSKQINLSFN